VIDTGANVETAGDIWIKAYEAMLARRWGLRVIRHDAGDGAIGGLGDCNSQVQYRAELPVGINGAHSRVIVNEIAGSTPGLLSSTSQRRWGAVLHMAEDFILFRDLNCSVYCGRSNGHLMLDTLEFDAKRIRSDPGMQRFLIQTEADAETEDEVSHSETYHSVLEKPTLDTASDVLTLDKSGILEDSARTEINKTSGMLDRKSDTVCDHHDGELITEKIGVNPLDAEDQSRCLAVIRTWQSAAVAVTSSCTPWLTRQCLTVIIALSDVVQEHEMHRTYWNFTRDEVLRQGEYDCDGIA